MEQIQEETLKWLTNCPASDPNFTHCLKSANKETINAALTAIQGQPGEKSKDLALRRQLRKLIGNKLEATKATNERLEGIGRLEMGTLVAEREERLAAEAVQADREKRIAEAHEIAGRIQAFSFVEKVLTVGTLIQLKCIKETKAYRDLPNIGTWEKYCDYLGFSRQKVDEDLANLAAFGEEFLQTVGGFGLGYREMKKLRQLTHDGAVTIEGDCLRIDDESIPIDQDHADDLQVAIERIITAKADIEKRVNKLEKDFKGALKEETTGLHSEIKTYKERVKQLEIYEPNEKDREWSVKQMEAVEQAAGAFQIAIAKFILDPRLKDDRHLQALVSGHLQEAELALQDVRVRLDEVIDMFN
jgi:hypothetical protein